MSLVKQNYAIALLLALSFFIGIPCKSQVQNAVPEKYYVEHFGEEEGLPQNSINNILPDKNDFLWIATEGGITRFNGNRFLPVSVKTGVNSNAFTRVKGFYNKGKDTIMAYSTANSLVATIVNNTIIAVEKFQRSIHGFIFSNMQKSMPAPAYFDIDTVDRIVQQWNLNLGSYAGTVYNKDSFMVTLNDGIGIYDSRGLVGKIKIGNFVNSRLLYVNHRPVYADAENYVNFYSAAGLQKRVLLSIPASGSPLKFFNNAVENNFFCVADDVLYRVDITATGALLIKKILTGLQYVADLQRIYEKDSNTIVTGTARNGLFVYKKQLFSITDPLPNKEPDGFYIQQLLADNQTILTGLDKLFNNDRYIGKTKMPFTTHNYSSLKDSKGNYWYVYYDRLLRAKEIGVRPDTMMVFKGAPGILFEDKEQQVWFSSSTLLGYFKKDTFSAIKISNIKPVLISYMQQDAAGRYLIGTREGLYMLNNVKEALLKEVPAFKSHDIRFIWPEANGQTWICTYGQGLFLLNGNGVVTAFPESNGRLAYVHCIIEDTRGNFWMPTNSGLLVTSRQSLMAYTSNNNKLPFYYLFSKSNGLRTNEFNGGTQPAYLRLPNGDISLASMQGLVRFHPDAIDFRFSASPILVDNIHLDSIEVAGYDSLQVANTVSNISFTLSSSFWGQTGNDQLEYQVVETDKMPGDASWVLVDASGKINLFSPSFGEYQLLVRKRKGLQANDYIYKTIGFTVLPKWFQTKAFFIGRALLFLLLLTGVFFWRRNYYRKSNRILKEKVAVATFELQQMNNTLEKKVEERTLAIKKEKDLSQSIINNLPGIFYIFDSDGNHMLWNKNFEKVTGYNTAEIKLIKAGGMLEEQDLVSDALQKVFTDGFADIESVIITKSGKKIPYYFNGITISYDDKPCVLGVGIDISERKKAEHEKENANYLLNERIKELTTLYRAGLVLQREQKSIGLTLQDFVDVLPAGWQHTDITAACITLGELEFVTPGFKPTQFSQSASFITGNGTAGKIEVVYLEERRQEDEGPFLMEERNLIDMLGNMLRIYFTRKEAIEALQKSEANLHTIFDTTDTVYALMDVKFQLIAFNQRAFDFGQKELKKTFQLHTSFIDYFPEAQRREIGENMDKVANGNHISYEVSYPQATEQLNWYYVRMFPITNAQKIVFGMMMAISDITEKKLLEQEILDQKIQEQKEVTRAILIGEEKERNKIGQELHDNINQILAGTKLYLGMARKAKENREQIINESMALIDSAIEEIRIFSKGKVTPMKKVNLEELLRLLIETVAETTNIHTSFVYKGDGQLIEDDLKLNIYRIMQEQLNNILKHARAKNITVVVEAGTGFIDVLIEDDGKGFDINEKKKGVGLSNMINRVESFNGTITIKSSPGSGCITAISIPLKSIVTRK